MKILGPTPNPRLNEAAAVVFLFVGLVMTLSLASYNPHDPSWNTATAWKHPQNLVGLVGSYFADASYNILGLASAAFPALIFLLGWKWLRSQTIEAALVRVAGAGILL